MELERNNSLLRSFELRIKDYEGRLTTYQQDNHRVATLLRGHMEENDKMRQQLVSSQNCRDFENEVDTWKRKFC